MTTVGLLKAMLEAYEDSDHIVVDVQQCLVNKADQEIYAVTSTKPGYVRIRLERI